MQTLIKHHKASTYEDYEACNRRVNGSFSVQVQKWDRYYTATERNSTAFDRRSFRQNCWGPAVFCCNDVIWCCLQKSMANIVRSLSWRICDQPLKLQWWCFVVLPDLSDFFLCWMCYDVPRDSWMEYQLVTGSRSPSSSPVTDWAKQWCQWNFSPLALRFLPGAPADRNWAQLTQTAKATCACGNDHTLSAGLQADHS